MSKKIEMAESDYARLTLQVASLQKRVEELEKVNLVLFRENENLRQGRFLAVSRCENCGLPVKQPIGVGRYRHFCSNKCRTAQKRRGGVRNF